MKKENIIVISIVVIISVFIVGYVVGNKKENAASPPASDASTAERKILYYRNPMGLADISDVPKKDSMGMDYTPVYEGEAAPANQVKINIDKMQQIGVKTEVVEKRLLTKTIRATGIFQVDERREHIISPRFNGWVEDLYVNTTGQVVKKNEPLMSIYSPELISAQQDFLLASQLQGSNQALANTAMQRLRYWDISDNQLQRLKKENSVQTLTLNSPIDGVVLEKNVTKGMRFNAGDTTYTIADLSSLWVMAEIFEQDLGLVHKGQAVNVHVNAYPNEPFMGTIDYVYPTVNATTRTTQVRIELPNPESRLKPDLYAMVELKSQLNNTEVLAVPNSAIIEGGAHNIVLIQRGEGLFEPKKVELGLRADDYTEVRSGLDLNDAVVTRANFLIDSESNLKAALSNFTLDNAHEMAPETSSHSHGAH